MPNKNISFLLIISLLAGFISADTYTWGECLALAKTSNRSLMISREKLKQADLAKQSAQANFWPQISAGAGSSTGHSATQTPVKSEQDNKSYSYSLSAKQNIFDGFKTKGAVETAQSNAEGAQYDYLVAEANVRLTLRTAFIDLLKGQEQLRITQQIKLRRDQNLALIQLRYDAGREHLGSLLVAKANGAQAESDVAQAKRSIELAKLHLSQVVGLATMNIIAVTENVQLATEKTIPDFENIVSANPTLLGLIKKIDAARHNLEAVRGDQLPSVYASYQNGKSGDSWPPDNSQWSLGANVSFTLFDGNKNGSSAEQAASSLKQAHYQELDGRETVAYTLQDAWAALQNAADALLVRAKYLSAAEARAKIADAQYSAGLINFDSWIIIEDNLVNTQKDFLNTKGNYLLAQARWIQVKGGGLDEN